MGAHAMLSLALRTQAGRWVWSIAAFLFPSLAAVEQSGAATALLLYLVETIVALAILGLRLQVAWHTSRHDPEARGRLLRTRRGVTGVLVMVTIGMVWGLGLVGILAVTADQPTTWTSLTGRVGPMVGTLLLAAALDTLIAPVRTPVWLETGMAWQASRASVVVASMLIGGPLAIWLGPSALVWSFLGLRLLADLGSLRRSERERIRSNLFDGPAAPDPTVRATAKAPPRFSAAHARHGVHDPDRLPD